MTTAVVLALAILAKVTYTEAACTMPDIFRTSDWQDNAKGNVSFTTWKMTGRSFEVNGQVIEEWEVVDNVNFEQNGYLALRSSETFTHNGTAYYSYMCMQFEKLTNDIYRYYTLHDREPLADNNNVLIADHDDLTRFDEICNVNFVFDKKLFGVFVRAGMEPSMTCPNPILATFKYEVTVPPGTVVCTPEETAWKGCDNIRQVELQNSSCNHPVAYSAGGKLNCIADYKDGDVTSIMLMNTDDTVDNVNTFRFSCAMVKDDGTEMVVSPRECFPGQTTSQFPMDRDGNTVGQRIQASSLDSNCRIFPEGDGDDDELSTPAIIGIVVGSVVFIVLIFGIVWCGCKMRD